MRLWDAATGKALRTLKDTHMVYCVAFDPAGRTLTSGGSKEGVRVWEIATGEPLPPYQASAPVAGLAFTPAGEVLAVGGYEVLLFDVQSRSHPNALWSEVRNASDIAFDRPGHSGGRVPRRTNPVAERVQG